MRTGESGGWQRSSWQAGTVTRAKKNSRQPQCAQLTVLPEYKEPQVREHVGSDLGIVVADLNANHRLDTG